MDSRFIDALINTITCLKAFHSYMNKKELLPLYLRVQYGDLLFNLCSLDFANLKEGQASQLKALIMPAGMLEISESKKQEIDKKDVGIDMFWSAIKDEDEEEDSINSTIHLVGSDLTDAEEQERESQFQEPIFTTSTADELNITGLELKEEDYKTEDKKRPFKCKICTKSFKTFPQLLKHIKLHQPHKCPICKHEFSHQANIKVHMRIHSGAKPFKCKICDKPFRQSNTCKDHERTHTGEKPFQCDACGQHFARRYSLNLHRRRIHTGEKPHQCSWCENRFASASQLQRHILTHTGERPHLCDICSAGFTTKTDLKKHITRHDKSKMVFTL